MNIIISFEVKCYKAITSGKTYLSCLSCSAMPDTCGWMLHPMIISHSSNNQFISLPLLMSSELDSVMCCTVGLVLTAANPMLSLQPFLLTISHLPTWPGFAHPHRGFRGALHVAADRHHRGTATARGLNSEKSFEAAAPGLLHQPQWACGCNPLHCLWGSQPVPRQAKPEELKGSVLFIKQMKRNSQSLPRRLYIVINGSINGELQCTQRNSKTCLMGPRRWDDQ